MEHGPNPRHRLHHLPAPAFSLDRKRVPSIHLQAAAATITIIPLLLLRLLILLLFPLFSLPPDPAPLVPATCSSRCSYYMHMPTLLFPLQFLLSCCLHTLLLLLLLLFLLRQDSFACQFHSFLPALARGGANPKKRHGFRSPAGIPEAMFPKTQTKNNLKLTTVYLTEATQ